MARRVARVRAVRGLTTSSTSWSLTLELDYNEMRSPVLVSGVHHVKLPVSDVARSRAWYERVLGFELVVEFVEDGQVRGVALRREDCAAQVALRHDPARAQALAGFD